MDLINYTASTVKDIDLPFNISDEKLEGFTYSVKIDELNIKSTSMDIYKYMWFCLKKEYDYKSMPIKLNKPNMADLNECPLFDGAFNLVKNFTYPEKIANNSATYNRFIERYRRKGEKSLWGVLIDSDTVKVGKNKILKYLPQSTEPYTTKVLVQPSEWDNGFFVYVDKENRPTKSMTVLYSFDKEGENLMLNKVYSDRWIY